MFTLMQDTSLGCAVKTKINLFLLFIIYIKASIKRHFHALLQDGQFLTIV
jgi:hypothetical protein